MEENTEILARFFGYWEAAPCSEVDAHWATLVGELENLTDEEYAAAKTLHERLVHALQEPLQETDRDVLVVVAAVERMRREILAFIEDHIAVEHGAAWGCGGCRYFIPFAVHSGCGLCAGMPQPIAVHERHICPAWVGKGNTGGEHDEVSAG